jgi:lipoteichoic acid synthase
MKRFFKTDKLLIYFFIAILFIDTTFRIATIDEPFTNNLLLSLVFSLSIAFTLYLLSSFFQGKVSFLLSIFLLASVALIYASQLVYYKLFKTFYSIYSAGNGGQVLEFWKEITSLIKMHSHWIFIIFLPVIGFILFGRKRLPFEKTDGLNKISLILSIILVHTAAMIIVMASGKEELSAYDLYYKNSLPEISAERLGIITTMRLDLQRLISGWSPDFEVSEDDKNSFKTLPTSTKNNPDDNKPKEAKIVYNTMKINFDNLIANETDPTIKEMHQYFQSVQPTEKNDYTGKYKDYNLILITAEGFSPYAVHKNVTPTLYKMVIKGYNFTNFYNPIWGVSTSDGEYVACTGLIPKAGIWSFRESSNTKLPFVMGNQFKKLNYQTMAYHNHTYTYYGRDKSHPNMGYDYKGVGNGLDVKKTWPESDIEMMEKTIPEYLNNQPFHTYYMTVSGHLRYTFSGNYIAYKNKDKVANLPYSEQAKAYIATQIELDRALDYLLTQLEEAGIADKTLIALSADHYPYGLDKQTIDELAGHPVENNFELYKSNFILYTKGMEPETITKPASSLDIIPTLSNLLGLEYDSRLLMGQDIFSNSSPLIIFNNKSFMTDKGSYNSLTRAFTPAGGAEVDDNYIKKISAIVRGKFYYSAKILETDYYRKIFGK